mmetsp:Transcript_28171/g.94891  ORF Transcript_28171/g.94891 Transcript_28171/m.94891 type:complete len:135 (+) Transcript_28171:22-426(+)
MDDDWTLVDDGGADDDDGVDYEGIDVLDVSKSLRRKFDDESGATGSIEKWQLARLLEETTGELPSRDELAGICAHVEGEDISFAQFTQMHADALCGRKSFGALEEAQDSFNKLLAHLGEEPSPEYNSPRISLSR